MIPLRSWTEIDLSTFERNLKNIKAKLPSEMQFISVVKADAYGHGLPQIVERSLQSGVHSFAVANIQEAYEIKNIGVGWPILLLGALLPGEEQWIPNSSFIPTITSYEELDRLNTVSQKQSAYTKIHLKIDTGMGRIGVWHEHALDLLNDISSMNNITLSGIYTHFSDPVNDPEFTQIQRDRLSGIINKIKVPKDFLIHSDNSASFNCPNSTLKTNAIRLGLIQYGINSDIFHSLDLAPTLSFYTKVGVVKNLPRGTNISYGKQYTLKKDSKIAVLTAGYGDGIPIQYGQNGSVIIHKTLCPILGQITMDQLVVDVSNLEHIQAGDTATIIGKEGNCSISMEDFSKKAETIPWEVLCSITKRVKRIYKNSRN